MRIVGSLSPDGDVREAARETMRTALLTFRPDAPVVVLSHFDADGLTAAAILVRALRHVGKEANPVVMGKGESPWDPDVNARLTELQPGGLIVADLGTRPDPVLPGCSTLVIDHHVPTGEPEGAVPRARRR